MVKEISAEEVAAKIQRGEKFHLVDVREIEEWKVDHLDSAILVPRGKLEREIELKIPAKNSEVVLYCERGVRSLYAAETMQQLGYNNVVSMAGGMSVWRRLALAFVSSN